MWRRSDKVFDPGSISSARCMCVCVDSVTGCDQVHFETFTSSSFEMRVSLKKRHHGTRADGWTCASTSKKPTKGTLEQTGRPLPLAPLKPQPWGQASLWPVASLQLPCVLISRPPSFILSPFFFVYLRSLLNFFSSFFRSLNFQISRTR